ncbi:hypothetical protein D3C86_1734250 [compost metagenome]
MGLRPTGRHVVRHRILRILQQVVDHLPQLGRIALYLGQIGPQRRMDHGMLMHPGLVDPIQMQDFCHQVIQRQRLHHGGRRARVIAEVVHHAFHCRHLVNDRCGPAL